MIAFREHFGSNLRDAHAFMTKHKDNVNALMEETWPTADGAALTTPPEKVPEEHNHTHRIAGAASSTTAAGTTGARSGAVHSGLSAQERVQTRPLEADVGVEVLNKFQPGVDNFDGGGFAIRWISLCYRSNLFLDFMGALVAVPQFHRMVFDERVQSTTRQIQALLALPEKERDEILLRACHRLGQKLMEREGLDANDELDDGVAALMGYESLRDDRDCADESGEEVQTEPAIDESDDGVTGLVGDESSKCADEFREEVQTVPTTEEFDDGVTEPVGHESFECEEVQIEPTTTAADDTITTNPLAFCYDIQIPVIMEDPVGEVDDLHPLKYFTLESDSFAFGDFAFGEADGVSYEAYCWLDTDDDDQTQQGGRYSLGIGTGGADQPRQYDRFTFEIKLDLDHANSEDETVIITRDDGDDEQDHDSDETEIVIPPDWEWDGGEKEDREPDEEDRPSRPLPHQRPRQGQDIQRIQQQLADTAVLLKDAIDKLVAATEAISLQEGEKEKTRVCKRAFQMRRRMRIEAVGQRSAAASSAGGDGQNREGVE